MRDNWYPRNLGKLCGLLLLPLFCLFLPCWVQAEAEMALAVRAFAHSARFEDQVDQQATLFTQFNWHRKYNDIWSVEIEPYLRLDSADEARSLADLRRAYLLGTFESFEIGLGVQQVFWGVTESTHLVDVVGQTDTLASLDQESKLGQPLMMISIPLQRGIFDFYLLPYFREQTFPKARSRLRFSTLIDGDHAQFEHPQKEFHLDTAMRINYSFVHADLGLSYFQGTSRQPSYLFVPGITGTGLAIQPYYAQIRQTGLELQGIWDAWLLKLEAIYRSGQPDLMFKKRDYWANTIGFEYSMYNIFGTVQDLGLILEYSYDDRRVHALTTNEQDWVGGVRWALNDLRGSELLLLLVQDVDTSARTLVLETSSEIVENWELSVEGVIFSNQPRLDILAPSADGLGHDLRDDDFIEIKVSYYF